MKRSVLLMVLLTLPAASHADTIVSGSWSGIETWQVSVQTPTGIVTTSGSSQALFDFQADVNASDNITLLSLFLSGEKGFNISGIASSWSLGQGTVSGEVVVGNFFGPESASRSMRPFHRSHRMASSSAGTPSLTS